MSDESRITRITKIEDADFYSRGSEADMLNAIACELHAHRVLAEERNRLLRQSNEMYRANYEANLAILAAAKRIEEEHAAKSDREDVALEEGMGA